MPMAGYHKPRGKYIVTGIDLSDCNITGIVISENAVELKGAIISYSQTAEIAEMFGVIVR